MDTNRIIYLCFVILFIAMSILTFLDKINYMIPMIILFFIYMIFLLKIVLYTQYINLFPNKCNNITIGSNSIYFINTKYNNEKLDKKKHFKWITMLLTSGPNIIGLYNDKKNLTKSDVEEQLTIFNNCFNYDCMYYRSDTNLSYEVKNYLKSKKIIIINNFWHDLITKKIYCK